MEHEAYAASGAGRVKARPCQAFSCVLLVAVALLLGCEPGPTPTPPPTPLPTSTPTPSLIDAEQLGREYLRAWQDADYQLMYGFLTSEAQEAIPAERFVSRYQAIADEATITSLTASISEVQSAPVARALITFTLTADTQMVGQLQLENVLNLQHSGGAWAVDWAPQAIFPLLVHDNLVHMFIDVPSRGSVYARDGSPLATNGAYVELGVVTGEIEDEARLLDVLAMLLQESREGIKQRYADAARPDWFMPVGQLAPASLEANKELLSSVAGITWREREVREYPQGNLAGQLTGYLAEISAERLAALQEQGYGPGDHVGVAGLEAWGEEHLAGRRGGTLTIISPDGRIVWTLAERAAEHSHDIHTTLDVSLQRQVQSILGSRIGAVVVLRVESGEVLAMVSSPGYDPNVLVTGSSADRQALLDSPGRPFVDRSIGGIYPPGSAFKIVTMSAGMAELGLTASDSYYCAGRWDGLLDGATRHCWLKSGHGALNYFNGLVYSCDTVFWEVGRALNERDPFALPGYARAFGLGGATGLNALDEADGLIPDPDWKAAHYSGAEREWLPRDAVNMAIGQGDVLVTPLQMANLVSAVANDGQLLRPYLVNRIHSVMEGEVLAFGLEVTGQLPVSAEILQVVRQAMEGVVTYGTASRAFIGASISMAGKSGTSEAPPNEPHAWFVGYAPAQNPQIAVAVVLEHGGEGGANAAPVFRQVVDAYLTVPQG